MRIGLVLAALAGAAALAGGGPARADTCRALEMRMMQLQASSRDTSPIHNLLIDRGCRSGRRIAAAPRQPRFARLQPARVRASLRREGSWAARPAGGTYRTLCVRSCDGYYFPISYSTTREHFAADQATCQQMCPAGDAELYYHAQSGEGPAEMLSLEGTLYTSLPTAFRHLSTMDKACTCRSSESLSVTAAYVASDAVPSAPIALLPKARPEPGEDPETLANRDGGFAPAALAHMAVANTRSRSSVRIVGAVDTPLVLLTSVPN